jgi:hypothetical protein
MDNRKERAESREQRATGEREGFYTFLLSSCARPKCRQRAERREEREERREERGERRDKR